MCKRNIISWKLATQSVKTVVVKNYFPRMEFSCIKHSYEVHPLGLCLTYEYFCFVRKKYHAS